MKYALETHPREMWSGPHEERFSNSTLKSLSGSNSVLMLYLFLLTQGSPGEAGVPGSKGSKVRWRFDYVLHKVV